MRLKKLIAAVMALMLLAGSIPAMAGNMDAGYNMPYYIGVDVTNQIVTIYNTADDTIARQMLTSSGMNDCTPNGTFYLTEKGRVAERGEWLWLGQYDCFVKFATRIYLGYMFHSLPFDKKDESTMQEEALRDFGMPTSHGCMRLRVDDAKFIAKKCLEGTLVKIYKSEEKTEELRQLLLVSSYTGEGGMTYNEFLGYSEDALGRGSGGTEVQDLQYRLADLGYYEGDLGGRYDTDTIVAVKHVQEDLGLAQTGITTPELQEVLFSADAPVSHGQVTLKEGRSGPVVKKLQTALQTLGVYEGEIDSVYDLDVTNAVKGFQAACGYVTNGVANAEVQQALYHQVEKLEETFGAGSVPKPEMTTEEIHMATMISNNNIIVRSQPDTDSKNLGKLTNGDRVVLNASKGDWSSITVGTQDGFIMSKYLKPYNDYNVVMKYDADGKSYQLGHTMAEYKAGAVKAADEFSAYYASEHFVSSADELVDYVTVNTGSDGVNLNLRATASSDGAILAEVPNGTDMRVLAVENGYTKVGYDEQIGYLLNDYLTTWQGGVGAIESTEVEEESYVGKLDTENGNIRAVVVLAGKSESVKAYKEPSEDAKVVGRIEVGTTVDVVKIDSESGWVKIRYKKKEGFMQDTHLQFQLM